MTRCISCGALIGPNADWCGQCYSPVRPTSPTRPPQPDPAQPERAEQALASLPPDIQITLASAGSSRLALFGPRGRNWVTAFIVVAAVGTDALFFPYVAYMVAYGVFVGVISGFALSKLWGGRSGR
jgi:hypothetical protein